MAIAIAFTPQAMNASQYDEVIKKLDSAGAGKPKGRLHHVCYGSGNQIRVLDIWDSRESFDQFGKTLMPILKGLGVDPGNPAVSEVHNIIKG